MIWKRPAEQLFGAVRWPASGDAPSNGSSIEPKLEVTSREVAESRGEVEGPGASKARSRSSSDL
jgi:hypothetical protein